MGIGGIARIGGKAGIGRALGALVAVAWCSSAVAFAITSAACGSLEATDVGARGDAADLDSAPSDGGGGAFDGSASCPDAAVAVCDDFERSTAQGPLNLLLEDDGGTVTIEGTPGSRYMHAEHGGSASSAGKALLARKFGQSVSKASLSARLRYDIAAGTTAAQILAIELEQPGVGCESVFLEYQGGSGEVSLVQEDTCHSGNSKLAVGLGAGIFQNVRIDVAVGGTVDVNIDGTSFSVQAASFLAAGLPTVSVGVVYAATPYGKIAVDADDLVFTAQ
jgi:hypothetical protein